MKILLPALLVISAVLVGCGASADHSGDIQAPIPASSAKSSGPTMGKSNVPAAVQGAIPGGGK